MGGADVVESAANGSVLVVDDVDDSRELYSRAFAEAGYAVEQATSGADALARFAASRPSVVIMDLAMPDVDGWEATRRIRELPDGGGVLLIVVTGHATSLGLQRARDAGADDICTKPCLPSALLSMVEKHLGKKRP